MNSGYEHYHALMNLCEGDSSFYYVDQMNGLHKYRIFSYRIASYSEFLSPYARECRGHMFEITENGEFIRCASMTPTKFFNLNENPMTMNLDFSDCDLVMDKADGSLISSYYQNGQVYFKSKTSLNSEQANAAMNLLHTPEYAYLHDFIIRMELNSYTVNLEYVSPTNRIVLPYQKDALIVLNVRRSDHHYGEYLTYEVIRTIMSKHSCEEYLIKNHIDNIDDFTKYLETIPAMSGIEGFVVRIRNGETVKVKTDWYVALHRSKDSVNSPRRLFEVVVNEAHDDLRGIFPDDEFLMTSINDMEKTVQKIYSDIKMNVEVFHRKNSGLDRKSYAILGQHEVPKMFFSLAMNLYLGKENNYKEWMIKHYKELGINDDALTED